MGISLEQRVADRYRRKALIMLLTRGDFTGYKKDAEAYYTEATMYNYSEDGMYFESDYAIQPGSDIHIKMTEYAPDSAVHDSENRLIAKVKWCKEIADSTPSSFGVGVQYS